MIIIQIRILQVFIDIIQVLCSFKIVLEWFAYTLLHARQPIIRLSQPCSDGNSVSIGAAFFCKFLALFLRKKNTSSAKLPEQKPEKIYQIFCLPSICIHSKNLNGWVSRVFIDQSQILLINPMYCIQEFKHQIGRIGASGKEIFCHKTEFSKE